MSADPSWRSFDPDLNPRPAIALRVEVPEHDSEAPLHRHRKGQLVLALRGGAICEVPGAVWMVPPHCAVWVPGDLPHSNRVTPNARICLLFVEPGASALPDKPCTLAISPLVLILALMVFGWLWGIIGLLLAVPLLVCVKIVLARVEGMEGWARLLE